MKSKKIFKCVSIGAGYFSPDLELARTMFAEGRDEEPAYDIDKTIRVIHEVDLALREHDDLDTWLRHAASRDRRR